MLIFIYCGHTENEPYHAALPYSNNTLIVARTKFWYDNHSRCYILQKKAYDTPSALIAAKLWQLPWDDLCESVEYLIEICLVLLQFHAVWKMRRNCSSTFGELCTRFAFFVYRRMNKLLKKQWCAGDLRHHDAHMTSLKLLTIPSVPHVASNGLVVDSRPDIRSSIRRLSIQGPIFGPHVSYLWLFGFRRRLTRRYRSFHQFIIFVRRTCMGYKLY